MYLGFRGNEPEMANLQKVYVVVYDYGDIEEKFYSDADEAAEAAEDTWNRLTLYEKRRQHIYSGVIRREDLNFDQMDEDDLAEGRVDWCCFTGTDTYPGAFDSEELFSEEQVKDVLEDGWEDGCYEFEGNQHIYSIALSSDGNYITDFATDDCGKSFSVSYPDGEYSDNGFEAACKELSEKVNAYLCPNVR